MTILLLVLSTALVIQVQLVHAVANYQKCLMCFDEHREDHFYCNAKDLKHNTCMHKSSWDCLEEDKISTFERCPELVHPAANLNYTFTKDNFQQESPEMRVVEILDGEGYWLQIDREPDGSYGTMSIVHESRFLYVFDNLEAHYQSGTELGLVEEKSAKGWAPRRVFVANGGLVPMRFEVLYNQTTRLVAGAGLIMILLTFLTFV